jgi:6-phospho-beta-glucosidase
MKKTLKLVTIGGGSSYTPELIEGLIKRYAELPLTEIWLVDVEAGAKKLQIIGDLTRRMIAKAGLPIEVYTTLNRKEALINADYVTTQLRVGQLDARSLDEMIPGKYNVIGQETNGPGGLFKALRTIPVILDIIKDCEAVCPNAWIVNFTNPAGLVTEAVFRYTSWRKFVGLCNVPFGMKMGIAKQMELDPARVEVTFGGLNHLVYALDVRYDGKSIMQEMIRKFAELRLTMKNVEDVPWSAEFITALGALPCSYHRYYFQYRSMFEHYMEEYATGVSRASKVKAIEAELFELYADPKLDVKPKQLEQRGGAYYSDVACNLITSIHNDRGDIQPVNTLNRGGISNLPDDVVVEISCRITKDGPQPIAVGPLSDAALGIVQLIKAYELTAAKAAVTGDYRQALLAMTMHPFVQSEAVAKPLLDDLLEAHRRYLPQFFKEETHG